MTTFVRGFNPVWSMVDLSGRQLDDTYYLFILQNTLPYLPSTVYHDASANVPWTNPIEFLANGTLPIDIFYDPDKVYRLEVRQGDTQADPLIYLVENYVPTGSGDGPTPSVGLISDNQITNAQFSLINFSSPYLGEDLTDPDPIEVAPGWYLNLEGAGNVGLEQVPLTSELTTPTNAPYALRITLSGTWTGTPYLSQRFNQAGNLWAEKYVSSAITTRIEGSPTSISAQLINSNDEPLGVILASTVIDDSFNQYTGDALLPVQSNPDVPPAAWIEYQLLLPTTVDIYVTSFQITVQDNPLQPVYQQDSIERQTDHTFHWYKDSILLQPKESLLVGWDFSLNPFQFSPRAITNVATFGYVTDQTVAIQQAYVTSSTQNNIATGTSAIANNYGFAVKSVTATNQFALVQFIDVLSVIPYWGGPLSSLVTLVAQKQGSGNLRVKMRLIYNAIAVPTMTQHNPIDVWVSGTDPEFHEDWTVIVPPNDPVFNLSNGANTLTFDNISLPAATAGYLGIVFYTLDNMDSSGTADQISFKKISLVPNQFAIDCNTQTYDQMLTQCQYYYETSFEPGTVATAVLESICNAPIGSYLQEPGLTNYIYAVPGSFGLRYKNSKVRSPTLSFYSGRSTTPDRVFGILIGSGSRSTRELTFSRWWTAGVTTNSIYGFVYAPDPTAIPTQMAELPIPTNSPPTATSAVTPSASIEYHYVADARLGVA